MVLNNSDAYSICFAAICMNSYNGTEAPKAFAFNLNN